MGLLQQEYRYGTGTIILEKEIRRRRDGLDAGMMKFLSEAENTFAPGGTLGDYGYGGLEIEEVSSVQVGEVDWENSLMVVGVISRPGARREIGYPKEKNPLTGWDEIEDCIITSSPGDYNRGDVHGSYSNMICSLATKENIYGSWWRVNLQYQGLMSEQPTKRVITVNDEVVTPGTPVVVTGLSGGWSTPKKAQVSFPKVVVKDTSIIIGASPTATIPGPLTPSSAPSIQSLSITGDLVYRWPHGWKLADIDRDEIAGTNIALQTLTYEYVWEAGFA